MTDIVPIRRALISVSDKAGLVPFAQALAARGVEILSTGGSAKALREAGVPVKEVSDHTGFPEIMDGRVKTLVPQIHGGILGRRDVPEHMEQMRAHGIAPIDLVAVNLYPFEATVAKGAPYDDCVENIDIGGPALIRAAAKNHDFVAVLTDPDQYEEVLAELAATGGTSLPLRRRLAGEAYARTAAYDSAIAAWFAEQREEVFPKRLTVAGTLRQTLRYGENPHQAAAFYASGGRPGRGDGGSGAGQGTVLQQPERHRRGVRVRGRIRCADDRHHQARQPVRRGVSAARLADAWDAAFRCDPVSPYGGIVAVNRTLDAAAAEKIAAIFTEVIIAPDADDAAKAVLARKKNLRVLLTGGMPDPAAGGLTFRSLAGGFLAQTRDAGRVAAGDVRVVTQRAPTDAEMADLLFAFRVCKHVKSNAIVFAKDGATVGIGGGQPNRVDSARIAAWKSGGSGQGGGAGGAADAGQRGGVGRVLPVRRWVGGGDRGRRDGGDPAGRLDPRCRGDRGGGCGRLGDGVHRDAAFPALKHGPFIGTAAKGVWQGSGSTGALGLRQPS